MPYLCTSGVVLFDLPSDAVVRNFRTTVSFSDPVYTDSIEFLDHFEHAFHRFPVLALLNFREPAS